MAKGKGQGGSDAIDLVWSGDLTIRRIGELRDEVSRGIAAAQRISIRFESVEEIDVALLQLLCSAHRTAAGQGKEFEILPPVPETVQQALKLTGFSRHAGCSFDNMQNCLWKSLHEKPGC